MKDILIKEQIKKWYNIPMFSLERFSYDLADDNNGEYSSYCTLYVTRIPTGWLVHEYDQPDCFVPYSEIDINYGKEK